MMKGLISFVGTPGLATLALLTSLTAPPAHAAKFANQFVEFELPPQWQCLLESAEWVCQNSTEAKKRDAIIVLAAKLKGDQDGIEQYLAYLKNPKTYTATSGKSVTSEVRYAKASEINAHTWADSLQADSELPGFYTRYLATVKQDIGVLVTYSINRAKYDEYRNDFDALVKTLKVFRKEGGINAGPSNSNLFDNIKINPSISEGSVFPDTVQGGGGAGKTRAAGGDDDLWLYLLVGAGLIGFVIWRKRRAG